MSDTPLALVRADAGPDIGSGHVMRCLSLAQALNAVSWRVFLISKALPDGLRELWMQAGRGLIDLPSNTQVGSKQDAQLTARHLVGMDAQALIVDHYGLDADWEQAANPEGRAALAIDDPPLRAHSTDWLLNQNLVEDTSSARADGTGLLQGPRYALLRPEFAMYRGRHKRQFGPVRRVLISLGGFDPKGYTWTVVQRCEALLGASVILDVVVGPDNPDQAALQAWASEQEHRLLTVQAQDMAARMMAADLAVGAGGSSAWERCCLGLPTVCVVLADNQRVPVQLGQRAGVLCDGGDLRTANGLDCLVEASQALKNDAGARERMSHAALKLVDGQGAGRVAACLNRHHRSSET